MPFQHRVHLRQTLARRAGALFAWLCLAIIVGGVPLAAASATPAAGSEATPMSEAIVDDVTISLVAWSVPEQGGAFDARVALTNRSKGPVSILDSVLLVTRNASGSIQSVKVTVSPGAGCSVQPDERVEFMLHVDLDAGEMPERLIIGLIETDRSGARVEFPLNGDGASAFGGSSTPGANAGEGTATTGTAIASPAGATPASSPAACGQH